MTDTIESLRQQLAECQATNGKLRSDMSLFLDSHEECEDFDGFTAQIVSMDDYHKAQEALALPNDATALNELIAEIENQTAEACAKRLESDANDLAHEYGYEDMGGLSFGTGAHAEAKMGRYNELMELAEALRSGEWRKYK